MDIVCNNCGAEFTARRGAKYCSPRCRTEAHRIRTGTKGQPRKRRPLPDAFWHATYDLERKADLLARLAEDDRFSRNATNLGNVHFYGLKRTVETLQGVLDKLPEPEPT